MTVLVHFVYKIQHGYIELYTEKLAEVGEIVKEIGITSFEMNRNHISLGLNAFCYEGLFPFKVLYDTVVAA